MEQHERKIIFLDIDGTLTEPGCNVPPESALEAIDKARANGHIIFLNTGRNYDMLSPLLQYDFDGVVASSGAYIMSGEKVLYDCPMRDAEKEQLMNVLSELGIFRTVECLDGSFTDEGFKIFLEEHVGEGQNSELLRWRRQIEESLNIRPMAEYGGQPIYKVVVMSPTLEQIEKAEKMLGDQYKFCIHDTDQCGFVNGEILKNNYDKGMAIECVCEELGISVSDTIAFGDSMNDLEMLEKAGLSICMENGSKTLKALADEICPSVADDGIYKAFQKHGLL